MRFVDVGLAPTLPARWQALQQRRAVALNGLSVPESRAFVKTYSGWTSLKKWLSDISFGKCWYCERRSPLAEMDVDHFRPKLDLTVDRVVVATHGGYWWLAYDWHNYRLSCQRCNRPNSDEVKILRGKWNEFPVRLEAHRAHSPTDPLGAEEPQILDPCVVHDTELLDHYLDGEVHPRAAQGTWEWKRARYTIDLLNLCDPQTAEDKRSEWQKLDLLIRCTLDAAGRAELEDILTRSLSARSEYATFLRSAIATHRDKEWIEALL
jgi:uncharacterized protein (TIGR02646 family)